MDIKRIVKSKKFKNIAITVIEILFVAGLIFGGLMFIQSKVTNEADKKAKVHTNNEEQQESKSNSKSDDYYIEVNKRLNAVIIYQYSKDKKTKEQVKVFRCSLGQELPKGKFKTGKKYSWLNIYQGWHKYNTGIGSDIWIQSVIYKDKYDYQLSKTSYRALGKAQADGKSILLSAGDAAWIYNQCKAGTEVVITKGKKNDVLAKSPEPEVSLYSYCGWDPTDPDKNNPYQKIANGKVVKGLSTLTIEKGQKPDYLGNLIALGKKGKLITKRLKYNEIDYSRVGNYKVNYKYKAKDGTKYKISQKIKVVDTTPPKVWCTQNVYTLEVKSSSPNDINIEENVKAIVNMVKAGVRADESIVDTQVYTLEKEQLREGEKTPVVVKVRDSYGNIGSCQVVCEIKVKEEETTEKETVKKEKTTTKKKQTNKKNAAKKKKDKKTTSEKTKRRLQKRNLQNNKKANKFIYNFRRKEIWQHLIIIRQLKRNGRNIGRKMIPLRQMSGILASQNIMPLICFHIHQE